MPDPAFFEERDLKLVYNGRISTLLEVLGNMYE
jgi:hypothetical protein